MSRSINKGPYVNSKLLKKLKSTDSTQTVVTWSRDSTIVPTMLGRTLNVYNGRTHIPVFVTEQMVGQKLGEFSLTRTFRSHVKSDRKSKR
jgi:small subunit ribosomal protein S19